MVAAVLIAIAVILVFVGIVLYPTLRARAPVPAAKASRPPLDSGATGKVEVIPPVAVDAREAIFEEPSPARAVPALFDVDQDLPVSVNPPIRWCQQFDPRSEGLDDTARLRLIGDLGVVAKAWCVPLLAQAYNEERRSAHRQAALTALAACHTREAIPTYRLALTAGDPAECAIATDALADLEPSAQSKPRTVVERR